MRRSHLCLSKAAKMRVPITSGTGRSALEVFILFSFQSIYSQYEHTYIKFKSDFINCFSKTG
jgi:hypothetical protein